ncbi:MAG: hypothetical protein AAB912_01685 [Patescibacteria group bacterium]
MLQRIEFTGPLNDLATGEKTIVVLAPAWATERDQWFGTATERRARFMVLNGNVATIVTNYGRVLKATHIGKRDEYRLDFVLDTLPDPDTAHPYPGVTLIMTGTEDRRSPKHECLTRPEEGGIYLQIDIKR